MAHELARNMRVKLREQGCPEYLTEAICICLEENNELRQTVMQLTQQLGMMTDIVKNFSLVIEGVGNTVRSVEKKVNGVSDGN